MTRQEIRDSIRDKEAQIKKITSEICELFTQDNLLCDEHQQYYEKEVEVVISKRPKVFEKQTHGFIKWKEKFKDESNDKVFEIERNQLVRIDGRWL